MVLSYIMTVGGIICTKEKKYIICGTPNYAHNNNELYIGRKDDSIYVESNGSNYEFKIKDVTLSTSIGGELSLGIFVYESENIHHIKVGDKVYSIIDDE